MKKTIVFKDGKKLHISDEPELVAELFDKGEEVIPCIEKDSDIGLFPFTKYAVSDLPELLESSFLKDVITEGKDHVPDHLVKIHQRLNNIPWTILETERLTVRETVVSDVPRFYEIYGDPSTTEFIEDLFEDPEEEIEYTKNYIERIYGFYGYGIWTVIKKDDGKIIGRAGVTDREGFDIPEIGFVIAPEYRRCGYAFEVCSAILDYAKNELGFSEIQALVKPENIVSIDLLKKLSFEITHTLHQGYLTVHRKLS
ncbi:MAG: GNAT family N-acetyltransferase [Lachnospiraceae bacterium]|nr:GNAT family N-acetyltransferase [Lachnospiraceae bacterium]